MRISKSAWPGMLALVFGLVTAAAPSAAAAAAPPLGKAGPAAAGTNLVPGDGGEGGGTTLPRVPAFFEQGVLVRSGETIQPLGPNLMGDRLNEFSGGLSFAHTDTALPGNNALPVEVGRQLNVGTRQAALNSGLFGDWDLEIPRLHTVAFADKPDWYGGDGFGNVNLNRCSRLTVPPRTTYQISGRIVGIHPSTWFSGYRMYVPGHGDQVMYRRAPLAGNGWANPIQPTDGNSYPLLTKQHWQISCLPTLARGSGEGFIALAPDGTRYRFDHKVQRAYPDLDVSTSTASGRVPRTEIWILPTLVTDRFGNWVRYNYAGADGWRLLSIEASDGRVIRFTYGTSGNRIQSAFDGTRTWTYGYDSSGALQTVTQPDGSRWKFALRDLERDPFATEDWGCTTNPRARWDPYPHIGTITHPSGAEGTFTLAMTVHGRTNVPGHEDACDTGTYIDASGVQRANMVPRHYAVYSLKTKTLSGPGMPAQSWLYEYSTAVGSFATCGAASCAGTKTVTITDPKLALTRNTYGTGHGVNEGLLLKAEVVDGGNIPRTTSYTYRASTAGPYPGFVGYDGGELQASMEYIYTPLETRTIGQQAMLFVRAHGGFDLYARPTLVTRSGSHSRTEQTYFSDRTDLWVLGQVSSHWIDGQQASSMSFHPATALPAAHHSFGLLQASYTFNTDGTLATVADGRANTTRFSNYARGLPQLIWFADGASTAAVVDNVGNIASVTNEVGGVWQFGYDTMGRLASKVPPGGGHPTVLNFEQVPYEDMGLGPNHWRQTIVTGQAVTVNYFDARWRKRLTTTYDAARRAETERAQRFDYDAYNRTTFASYPVRAMASITTPAPGSTTTYDALGRPTRLVADSELGPLTTTTEYLDGHRRHVTNPRGFPTTTAFQTFDSPSEDHAVSMDLTVSTVPPESVSVVIERDAFGKALSINRGGSGKSVVRRFVYDVHHRLCKTVEPESGATVQGYDGANNVVWRASGQAFPGPGCETQVAGSTVISHAYDARNRLLSTSHGYGSQNITRSYTPDGMLSTIGTTGTGLNPITWAYSYDNRRLLTQERYTWGDPNYGWDFVWQRDAYGHVVSLTDPSGTLHYAPDALGRPTQVSGYASGVRYHPDGAVAGYTLGNGITHVMTPNLRGLPEVMQHGSVVRDRYTYDANGNVTAIADETAGGVNSRSMTLYDGLDRLQQASGPWGAGSFRYDALDNLTGSTVGGRSLTHHIDPTTNRLVGFSGSLSLGMAYDANGNVVQRGGQGFTFDIGNRMTRAAGKASYVYDGHGRRNLVWFDGGGYMHQAYTQDGKLRFAWRSSQGGRRHVYLGDRLIAETTEGGVTTYVHTDGLGSPVAKTSNTGAVVERTRYEPYGATVAGSTNPTTIGYTGHVNDGDTGLVYMQQRYYDPIAGRFLSVDPVTTDAKSGDHFNRYVYANNNSYRYIDPNGNSPAALVGALVEVGFQAYTGELGSAVSSALGGNLSGLAVSAAKVGVSALSGGISSSLATKGADLAAKGAAAVQAGTAATAASKVAGVATSQAANGAGAKVSTNAVESKPLGEGVGAAAAVGATIGTAGSYAGNALAQGAAGSFGANAATAAKVGSQIVTGGAKKEATCSANNGSPC